MNILDGKTIAKDLKATIQNSVQHYKQHYNDTIKLVIIHVGNDDASYTYIRNKKKACEYVGISMETHHFDADVGTQVIVDLIKDLNNDDSVTGILVQLPLPQHMDKEKIINTIDPLKDVDGFTLVNSGKLARSYKGVHLTPCTPKGIMALLKYNQFDVAGNNCVVVGRSNIVGRPMAELLTRANATVTLCHSHTKNLKEICKQADVLVCAVGKPKLFTTEYIKDGAIVIDVGMNRDENNKLCGDVDFENVVKMSYGAITPVPGGVGPMTVAALMDNCVLAYELQHNLL